MSGATHLLPELGSHFSARYRLVEPARPDLGGQIFRARDDILARDVAVEVFRLAPSETATSPRRQATTRALAGFDHPSLATLYDANLRLDGDSYLVSELIDGPSLREYVANGPVAPETVASLISDLVQGLATLHAQQMAHRRVTSAAIFLRPLHSGHVLFGGVLTHYDAARLFGGHSPTPLTGINLAPPTYLTPAEVHGGEHTTATDVYALGLVALEALSGDSPLRGGPLQEVLLGPLAYDPEIPTSFGHGWQLLLTAMTDPNPQARPTASEVSIIAATLSRNPELLATTCETVQSYSTPVSAIAARSPADARHITSAPAPRSLDMDHAAQLSPVGDPASWQEETRVQRMESSSRRPNAQMLG